MRTTRTVRHFGDSALIADLHSLGMAHRLAASVTEADWSGVQDVVVGDGSVTILADPRKADLEALADELSELPLSPPREATRRRHEIPVTFDGPDLEEVARLAGTTCEQVIEMLVGSRLRAAFLGFSPGFAYLRGLPPPLKRIARRDTPRTAVQAGSLALGGGFAAVYPQRSPGGWWLVGRTNIRLFDPDKAPFSLLQPGDLVRLVQKELPSRLPPTRRRALTSPARRAVEVQQPGPLSLVEDEGRVGVARLGVPRAGGADPFNLRLANRLVGNADGAAGIEVNGSGPVLRARCEMHVAVVGDVDLSLDGRPVPSNTVLLLGPGQILRVGTVTGTSRAYVALGGGARVPVVLGSRSTDTLCGLGCGPLREGDVIALGPPTRPRGWLNEPAAATRHPVLRVVPGPELFPPDQLERLVATTWTVGSDSNRVGARMTGGTLLAPTGTASRGMVTGAIQVPPGGGPIVLLCDHATLGGYPVVATVVGADIGLLGRIPPGTQVRFEVISRSQAREALALAERALDSRLMGRYPTRVE